MSDFRAGIPGHLGLRGGAIYTEMRVGDEQGSFQPLELAIIGTKGLITGWAWFVWANGGPV